MNPRSCLVLLCVASLTAGCGGGKKGDQELLQGTWTVVSAEGKEGRGDDMLNSRMTFFGSEVSVKKISEKGVNGTFQLEEGKDPKEIDLVLKNGATEVKIQALYSLEPDTLKLCFADPKQPRPTKLVATQDQGVMTLKRAKP